jgi:hypothetical protein
VVVAAASGARLDVFSHEGAFLRRIALASPGCGAAPVRELLGGSGHVVLLRLCTRRDGRTSVLVERVGPTGERTLLEERLHSDLRAGTIDPTRAPLLARAEGRLYLGLTPERCVREVGAGPGQARVFCHPDSQPVMLPDSMRARLRELAPRFDGTGATLVVPERYPPFDALLEVDGRLAFQVLLDEHARAWDVVAGRSLERIVLPVDVKVFAGARAVLMAREEPRGTAFGVLPLP